MDHFEVTVSDVTDSDASHGSSDSDSYSDSNPAESKLAELRRLRGESQERAAKLAAQLKPLSAKSTKDLDHAPSAQPASRVESKQDLSSPEMSMAQAASDRFTAAAKAARERKAVLQQAYAWKKQLLALSRSVRSFDRECSSFVSNSRGEMGEVMREVELEKAAQDSRRKKEGARVRAKVEKAKWTVNRFLDAVEEVGTGDVYLERLKTLMEAAQKKVAQAKEEIGNGLEEAIQEEMILQRQVDHFDAKMKNLRQRHTKEQKEQGGAVRGSGKKLVRQRSCQGRNSGLSAQVERIDNEIAALGGSVGGWDSREHQCFLQVLSRLKITTKRIQLLNISDEELNKVAARVVAETQAQDDSSVRQHIQWYSKYIQLLQQKKDLVQSWKSTARPPLQPQKFTENVDENAPRAKTIDKAAQALKKSKVEEWRKAKALKDLAAKRDEEEQRQLEKRQQKLLAKKREREKELRALQKLEREAAMAESSSAERMSNQQNDQKTSEETLKNRKALKDRQKKNMELAFKRREAHERAQQKKVPRMKKLERIHVKPIAKATRDSRRLLKTTTAQRQKRLTPHDLDEHVHLRNTKNAHEGVVPSAAGAERRVKGYGIALGPVSGRMVPTWKR